MAFFLVSHFAIGLYRIGSPPDDRCVDDGCHQEGTLPNASLSRLVWHGSTLHHGVRGDLRHLSPGGLQASVPCRDCRRGLHPLPMVIRRDPSLRHLRQGALLPGNGRSGHGHAAGGIGIRHLLGLSDVLDVLGIIQKLRRRLLPDIIL